MSDEIERKIISMFGLGMSYLDIAGHISEIYGLEVSNASISAITDKLIPEIKAWQNRPLASHYPFVHCLAGDACITEKGARCDSLQGQAGRALCIQGGLHGFGLES